MREGAKAERKRGKVREGAWKEAGVNVRENGGTKSERRERVKKYKERVERKTGGQLKGVKGGTGTETGA